MCGKCLQKRPLWDSPPVCHSRWGGLPGLLQAPRHLHSEDLPSVPALRFLGAAVTLWCHSLSWGCQRGLETQSCLLPARSHCSLLKAQVKSQGLLGPLGNETVFKKITVGGCAGVNDADSWVLDSGSHLGRGSQQSSFSRHVPVGSDEAAQGQHFDKA